MQKLAAAKWGCSLLIPSSFSEMWMLLLKANFSACKLIADWKLHNKQYYLFFIVKVFVLKFYFCFNDYVVNHTCTFTFNFVLFILNVISFVYNVLKQTLILFRENEVIALYKNSWKHLKQLHLFPLYMKSSWCQHACKKLCFGGWFHIEFEK